MLTDKNKITIRQTYIIFIIITLSPAIRLFPSFGAQLGEKSAWTAPIISVIPLFIILCVLNAFFKNSNNKNLSDAFISAIGKIPGKVVLGFYLIWGVFLYFLYIRYFATRLLMSTYPNVDIRFFILVMLLIVYIAIRGKIETFARFSEIFFLLITLVFIIFFIFLCPSLKVSNLLPLTHYDIGLAIKSTYPVIGVWCYVTLLFFLGEHMKNKQEIKKLRKQCLFFLSLMTTLMMIFVLGSLGYEMTQRMPLPFFNVTKLISVLEMFNRFESILLAIWVAADYILIVVFALIIMHIGKSLFDLSEAKYFSTPVIFLGYVGSLYIASSHIELEQFSNEIGLSANILFFLILPSIILFIGKVRKKV